MNRSRRFGPGLLVMAAFIGPGTVTTATLAGARFGYALLWVLLFSVIATIVLQEMSARLGLVTRAGLGEALRKSFTSPIGRICAATLVVVAIVGGNTAYQAGNITGAAVGLTALTGIAPGVWSLMVGGAAALLLFTGRYKVIERVLIGLVLLMSAVFIITAAMVKPDFSALLGAVVLPTLPCGSATVVIALIGTTVVPYNLFLHASAVQEKWSASQPVEETLRTSRLDTTLAVTLGGVVTLAIVVTASSFFVRGAVVANPIDMAGQLEPLLGSWAKVFFAVGLLSAGLTSSITAPLAAAYAAVGVLGRPLDMRSLSFRLAWLTVIAVGTLVAVYVDKSPISIILFAQAANGLLLPVVAVFLLIVVNNRSLMSHHANRPLANTLGVAVVLVVVFLGLYKLKGVYDSAKSSSMSFSNESRSLVYSSPVAGPEKPV